jgi:fumarate hydratase subunit beta
MKKLTLPLTEEALSALRAGESVLLSGTIYTARDCAHKRIFQSLDEGKELPFPLENSIIYYAGPCPAPAGKACGSCGPTTSARMNVFAPRLLDLGLGGMIGKGEMSESVTQALVRNKKVYFAAIGGAAALIAKSIKSEELLCYEDLGTEAIRRYEIEDFPCIVVIDSKGNNVYETEPPKYRTR